MAKKRRGRRGRRANLTLIPAGHLRAELDRRVDALAIEEEELQQRLNELRNQIAELRGASAAGGSGQPPRRRGRPPGSGKRAAESTGPGPGRRGRRPKNEMSLRDALLQSLRGKTMGVEEAMNSVLKSGYRSSSANFRTIVNQALLNKKLFKNVDRGRYTTV